MTLNGSAASLLAVRLQKHGHGTLALQLGHAIDHLHHEFDLVDVDRQAVLDTLGDDCPEVLAALREQLAAERLAASLR